MCFSPADVIFFVCSMLCACSRPLKTCPWALVGWTRVDPPLSLLMATTCLLRVWSVVALQPHTCRTRWMDRCLVSAPSPLNFSPSSLYLSCLLLFPSVLASLGLPSNNTELWGRSACWRMMSPFSRLWWSCIYILIFFFLSHQGLFDNWSVIAVPHNNSTFAIINV